MRLFLVRHGTSVAHETGKRQSPVSPLSEKGRQQAEALGDLIAGWDISFEQVFTSKLARARETAEIVAEKIKAPVEEIEGIHEKEQHPGLYGADITSKIHHESVAAYVKYARDMDYKFKGEGESIREVAQRASRFVKHLLEKHLGEDVLVVSHGNFIRSLICACVLGEKYNDEDFAALHDSLIMGNTGVSLLEFDEEKNLWRIIYLNNFSHLRGI